MSSFCFLLLRSRILRSTCVICVSLLFLPFTLKPFWVCLRLAFQCTLEVCLSWLSSKGVVFHTVSLPCFSEHKLPQAVSVRRFLCSRVCSSPAFLSLTVCVVFIKQAWQEPLCCFLDGGTPLHSCYPCCILLCKLQQPQLSERQPLSPLLYLGFSLLESSKYQAVDWAYRESYILILIAFLEPYAISL